MLMGADGARTVSDPKADQAVILLMISPMAVASSTPPVTESPLNFVNALKCAVAILNTKRNAMCLSSPTGECSSR